MISYQKQFFLYIRVFALEVLTWSTTHMGSFALMRQEGIIIYLWVKILPISIDMYCKFFLFINKVDQFCSCTNWLLANSRETEKILAHQQNLTATLKDKFIVYGKMGNFESDFVVEAYSYNNELS